MGLRGWKEFDDLRLVKKVETGLPVSAARKIALRIDPAELHLRAIDLIPKATYYRRIEQKKPLSKDESEKIVELSKVFSETLRQYHNDTESASMFLRRKHPLLGNRSPFEIARESTVGANLVLKLLARAEASTAA